MDSLTAQQIILKTKNISPFASGNSRKCYAVDDYAILIENGDEDQFKKTYQLKSITDTLSQNQVNTPKIHYVEYENNKIVMVQDLIKAKPLYYRNYHSFCLGQNLSQPIAIEKIKSDLKAEYDKSNNVELSDYFEYTEKQQADYHINLDGFINSKINSDSQIREQVDYYNQINNLVNKYNKNNALLMIASKQVFFDKFLIDLTTCASFNIAIDCHSDNYLFNENSGFTLIDLPIQTLEQQNKLTKETLIKSCSYFYDILTRGIDKDTELTKKMLEKCFVSAESLGLSKTEYLSRCPTGLKDIFADYKSLIQE